MRFRSLDEELMNLKTTHLTLSDILKNSVNLYYELTRVSSADRLKAFEEAGFIGCGEGDAHLSVNYEKRLEGTDGAEIWSWLIPASGLPWPIKKMEKYANLPMDLADASLVILAEHLGHGRIPSSDVRDFNVYRWKNNESFENLFLK